MCIIIGPTLPYELVNSAMSEIPDGVLLFGGFGSYDEPYIYGDRKEILQLQAGGNSWNILDTTLKKERSYHVAIPLQ